MKTSPAVKPQHTPHNEKGHASFGHCPKCEEKTKAQHTLTPWELDGNEDAIWLCSGEKILGSITDITKEDAAFIVRACNNFEQMLSALKYVVDSGESYERVQEIAEQAIVKAEGKE